MSVSPLFLFSLPRSGSTLVQRMLSKHPGISTLTEPWILLPLLYARKQVGVVAEYGHTGVYTGVEDLIKSLPNGEDDYLESVAKFALDIYSRAAAEDAVFFLDKTPRNSLVSDEILKAFPDGKFIFLWRNPLAIASSMIETFGHGRWNLYRFEVDLYKGLDCLLTTARHYSSDRTQIMNICYEDFVSDPGKTLSDIYEFLGINSLVRQDGDIGMESLKGRLGDPTGIKKYNKVSTDSIDTWASVLSSPLRKRWALNYLHRIGKADLEFMGYDMNDIITKLENTECSKNTMSNDMIKMLYGKLYGRLNLPVLKNSLMGKRRWKYPLY